MKKQLCLKLIALCALVPILFLSCRKTLKEEKQGTTDYTHLARTIPSSLVPTVTGGMLSFRDNAHFQSYIVYLNTEGVRCDTTNPADTIDGDQRLDSIELALGYTSLRSVINTQWDILNQTGWSDPKYAPDLFFIHDRGVLSVYNADRNVMVGGMVNHIHNDKVGIIIKNPTPALLSKVDRIPDSMDLDLILSDFIANEDEDDIEAYPMNYEPVISIGGATSKITADTTWVANCYIDHRGYELVCSNNNRKYVATKIMLNIDGVDPFSLYTTSGDLGKLDVYVDWGDGTNNTYYGKSVRREFDGQNEVIRWAETDVHGYNSGGTKTITVKIKRPYHPNWVGEVQKTITIPTYECSVWASKSTGWWWAYSNDGQRAVSGIVETFQNWWGNPVFHSTSKAWKWQNGSFKHKKADQLVCQMWFDTYEYCNGNPSSHNLASWAFNDRTTDADIGWFNFVNWNATYAEINSNHRIWYNGAWVELNKKLLRCD